MKIYRKEIIKIWRDNRELNLLELSPLTLIPDNSDIKNLIVGINPSNSFNSLQSVIKDNLHQWNASEILIKIKTSEDYRNFLLFDNFDRNEQTIIQLQKLCHQSHFHFRKQKNFLKDTNVTNYDFIDLFPIWKVKQGELLENLSNCIEIEKVLIHSFLNYLNRNRFERVIFLNKGSFQIFSNYFNQNLKLNPSLSINTGGVNFRNLISGSLVLDNYESKICVIGIGGRNNNDNLIKEINKINFFN